MGQGHGLRADPLGRRVAAVDEGVLRPVPSLKAAYTEIFTGKVDNATAGPLLGDYYQVNDDLVTAEDNLFSSKFPSPTSVLASAAAQTTADIKSYNSSL